MFGGGMLILLLLHSIIYKCISHTLQLRSKSKIIFDRLDRWKISSCIIYFQLSSNNRRNPVDAGIALKDQARSILTYVTTSTTPTATNYEGAINNRNIKGLSDLSRPPTSGATSDTWSDDAVMSAAKCTRAGWVCASKEGGLRERGEGWGGR